jgi:two-component system, cell cycle sensor histidine kinase and response regulator CckA
MLSPTILLHQATVLVVDDEEPLRLYVSRIMEDEGYRTISAGDGAEALMLLDQCEDLVQLVITDISMPNMGGLELAARLSRRPHAPPVLFMSGNYPDTQLTGPLLTKPLLAKPFLPQDLGRMVRRLMALEPAPTAVRVESLSVATRNSNRRGGILQRAPARAC